MQRTQYWPMLGGDLIKVLVEEKSLPKPAEQARNLLIWLGNTLSSSEATMLSSIGAIQSSIGAATADGAIYILKHLESNKLVYWRDTGGGERPLPIGLTFNGWEEYERVHRATIGSRIVFMAMQFNDPELNNVVDKILKPAVAQTRFELRLLSDTPRAGLIDDRLRVEIRQSRFLIADLTHRNPGAY